MQEFYVATERFDPEHSTGWEAYAKWAKIPGLKEVVSLDVMLCPPVIKTFSDDDWLHVVQVGESCEFSDLDYLLQRVGGVPVRNILYVCRNPEKSGAVRPTTRNFEFLGYDLIEDATHISALTNCGGFPNSFANDELNAFGLLSNFERAIIVRRDLREKNPEEAHAECELYAISRLIETG